MRLSEVIPWGRSFDEYRRMFALSDHDLAGRILGCGDGPASFNAQATAKGHAVISCDPIYSFSATEIEGRVHNCYDTVISQVKQSADAFIWADFRDADDLGRHRLAAMRRFLEDYNQGKSDGRCLVGSLPSLPFDDRTFTLALVSHLLFLYSEQFSIEAHIAAVVDLLRVADDVRIFPLLTLERRWSPQVEPVKLYLEKNGFSVTIAPVDYEFQKAENHTGNRMMRVCRRPSSVRERNLFR